VIVERPTSAGAFLRRAESFLLRDEVAHNLIVGIARRLATGQAIGQAAPLFAVMREGSAVVGAAVWTPPWRLLLSVMPAAASLALADAMHGWRMRPSGAVGPRDSAQEVCERLAVLGGGRALVARAMRAFSLESVVPAPPTPGRCRRAVSSETALVSDWYAAFWRDAALQDPTDPREAGAAAVRERRVFVWDDCGPRCLAAVGRTTPGGASLGPVFTPPGDRRRGYATALVAAASQSLLDDGHRFCCLFTDLANPISNSIYPKVGYRAVCDFAEMDMANADGR
jgi:hypothetical protein